MSDADYNRFAKFDLNGKLLTYWGVTGKNPGEFNNLHNCDVNASGNLFAAAGALSEALHRSRSGLERARSIPFGRLHLEAALHSEEHVSLHLESYAQPERAAVRVVD